MFEHTGLKSITAPIQTAASSLYDHVAEQVSTNAGIVSDGNANVGARALAGAELGVEALGGLAVVYGASKLGLSRFAGAEQTTSSLLKFDSAAPNLAAPEILERAAGITGKIEHAIPLQDEAGMTLAEFDERLANSDFSTLAVRAKTLGPIDADTFPETWQPLVANRTEGAAGSIGDRMTDDGKILVNHLDGSVAAYRYAELEPATIAAATAKDASLVLRPLDQPIGDLKVGDTLERGSGTDYPTGVRSDWQPWHGAVTAMDQRGSSMIIPGGRLLQKGVTLLDKNGLPSAGNPLDVHIGSVLDITHPEAISKGKFTITDIDGLHTANTSPLLDDEYRVVGLSNGQVDLASTSRHAEQGLTYTIPRESVSEPAFRRIESFSVKPGDQVIAPTDARVPNFYDSGFRANLQGRKLTVSGVQDNGVVLSTDADTHYLVPHDYLNTRTMFPLEQWRTRLGSTG